MNTGYSTFYIQDLRTKCITITKTAVD